MSWLNGFSPSMVKMWEAIAGLPGPLPALAVAVIIVVGLFVISCFTNAMSGRTA